MSDAPRACTRKKPRSSSGVTVEGNVIAAPMAIMAKPMAIDRTSSGVRMAKSITRSKPRANAPGVAASAVPRVLPGSKRADRTGARVSAVIDDRVTAKASTKPNSEKTPPACPGRKEIGMKTAASVAVVEITAKNTSFAPEAAAAKAPMPDLRLRTIFSTTTMASSTTIPVANTSARRLIVLTENPVSQIAASVPINATGIVTAGINVARGERRNRKITTTTMPVAMRMDLTTSLIDPSMKIPSFEVTSS